MVHHESGYVGWQLRVGDMVLCPSPPEDKSIPWLQLRFPESGKDHIRVAIVSLAREALLKFTMIQSLSPIIGLLATHATRLTMLIPLVM